MLPLFVEVWGPDGPFLPLLRAASSSQRRPTPSSRVSPGVAPMADVAMTGRPSEPLQSAHTCSVSVARYIIGIPPLVDMDDQTWPHGSNPF
jgi:hypothetical protein